MNLKENLKRIRKENNLSQEQLAEKLGVSRQSVSKWEQGQSYPEMDKMLQLCELFHLNLDELMNENIKEVNEMKQSKNNRNKYIEEFFEFISKTVDMFSGMTMKERIKCILEQIILILLFFVAFFLFKEVLVDIFSRLFNFLPDNISYSFTNIFEAICIILSIIFGAVIILHVFKIRYLDYYKIIKEENDNQENSEENKEKKIENLKSDNKSIILTKKQEKVIIRDPSHTPYKFLSSILKCILGCIKLFAILLIGLCSISFIIIVIGMILNFLIIKTGIFFAGIFLSCMALLLVNYLFLKLLYYFIFSKKVAKAKIAIGFILFLIFFGIGVGLTLIGSTKFNITSIPENERLKETYQIPMTKNLMLDDHYCFQEVKYITKDIENVEVVVEHSKYYKSDLTKENETILVHLFLEEKETMEFIRTILKDITEKKIKDYSQGTIFVYASKENIQELQANIIKRKEKEFQHEQERIAWEEQLEEKNEIIFEYEEKLVEKEEIITNLKEELENLKEG